MKLIFTYDSTELEDIGRIAKYDRKAVEEKHVLTIEKDDNKRPRNLYDVASDIKKQTEDDTPCIIFINQYLACVDEGFEWLQHNAGIALIKFLRMMEVSQHIVLITPYADDPLRLVRENPANLIITSKGISYTKYLPVFLKKPLGKLEALANKQFDANPDYLKPYLKVDFELPQDERHNWANWWGIYRLWYIHTFVKEIGSREDIHVLGTRRYEDYPYLKDHFKQLRNRVAMYLFGYKEANLVNIFNRLSELKRNVDEYELHSTWVEKVKKEGYDKAHANYIDSWIKYNDLSDREKKFEESLKSIRTRELLLNLFALREYLQAIKPKILLIDDQADEGWGDIFQRMIYGSKQDKTVFQVLPDKDEKNDKQKISDIDAFYETVIKTVKNMRPDIVLLDLRLNGETGTWINVKELSGAQFFKMIREEDDDLCREVPVVITTASNKFWSFERLHRINEKANEKHKKEIKENTYSFGYWSKEGLDVILSDDESIDNYVHLLECIIKPFIPTIENFFKSSE